ncbi:hypothetical protein [uncultured Bacteroides sp.]|uniref:hypothetical protein n=1 Tax=uncultured Bacteroides sp. TaxID=162156 RepID=UPI00280AAC8F|nr:hypothetical protein [uncultured Bacteroides sp.]
MKKILLVILVAFTSFTGVRAQNFLGDFAKTMVGLTVNYKGAEISALLNQHYGVPMNTLNSLYVSYNNNWGDVAATLELSNYLNRPVYDVYSCYNKNKGKGWGVIAKEMGIKPGSDQFKRLKSQMSQKDSYWKNTFKDYGKKKNPKVAYKKRTALKSDLYRNFDKKSKEMKGNDKAKGKKENKGNKNKSKHANNGR